MNFLIKRNYFNFMKVSVAFYSSSSSVTIETKPSEIDSLVETKLRPFSKEVLLSCFDLDLLEFPEVDNSDSTEKAIKVSQEIEKLMKARRSMDRDVLLDKLSATGIVGVTIPEVVLGGGYTWIMVARVVESLALDTKYTLSDYLPQMLACETVMKAGNESHKETYVRAMVNGTVRATVAITEGPSDLVNDGLIRATASLTEDGLSWIICGRKSRVYNFQKCDLVLVWAQTCSGEVIPFIVDTKCPGISEHKSCPDMIYSDLTLTDVRIPRENILSSKPDIQFPRYISAISNMGVCATCSSLIKSLIHQVNNFICSRSIFGTPLSQFKLTEAKVADLTTEAYSTESVTYMVAGMLDKTPSGDVLIESISAKVYSLESLRRTVDLSLSIVGVNAFTDPSFGELFQQANIVLRSQVSSLLSRKDSTHEAVLYFMDQIKRKKFSLLETVNLLIGNYKIQGQLPEGFIVNSFKYNVHQRLGHLADSLYGEYFALTKVLKGLRTVEDDLVRDSHFLEMLSVVLVDSLVMFAVLGRASRSICIGLRNHDHEVRLAELISGRISLRIKEAVSSLKKYPEEKDQCNELVTSDLSTFMFRKHALTKNKG